MKKSLLFIFGLILTCKTGVAQFYPDEIAQCFLPHSSYFNGLQVSDYLIDTLCWDFWEKTYSPEGVPYQYLHHNRLVFTYDVENRINQIDAYGYSSDPSKEITAWYHNYKFVYEYDENGRTTCFKKLRKSNNNWKDDDVFVFFYNEQGLIDTIKRNYYGGMENHIDSLKYAYSYDENGNRIDYVLQQLNSYYEWTWHNLYHHQYTYENGKISTDLDQTWNNDSWRNTDSISYAYENGQVITNTHLKWNVNGGYWYNYENTNYEYYPSENTTSIVFQTWNDEWVNKSRTIKQFDDFGTPIQYAYQLWQNEEWVDNGICSYSVNESNNCTDALCKQMSSNGIWTESRDNYSMNVAFNNGISILPITGLQFHVSYLSTTALKENDHNELATVYPNPGISQLNIQTDTPITQVTIYDMMGRQVFNQTMSETTIRINTENWPAGVYFWKTYNSSYSFSGKWIKTNQ